MKLFRSHKKDISKEIDLVVLEDRLGPENIINLLSFISNLKSDLHSKAHIDVGFYVVGSSTYPEEDYGALGKLGDIDLIVAPYFKDVLIPNPKNPLGCRLSDAIPKLDKRIKNWNIFERRSRESRFLPYGRPNAEIKFKSGLLPIHLIVGYMSPEVYKIGCSADEQYSFRELIEKERKNNNPFCLI